MAAESVSRTDGMSAGVTCTMIRKLCFEKLMDGLQPDQQRIMQSILSSFAKPKVKESMN